jgi:Mrp family chromosome partitioning ATPase
VLFDSPPILVVTDAAILGSRTDGLILVNDAGNTRTAEARRAVESLRRVRVNLLGVVLNRIPLSGRGAYYYNYSYYTSETPKKGRAASRKPGERQNPPLNQAADKSSK